MDEIVELIKKALSFDEAGRSDAAIYFYGEAASEIISGVKEGTLDHEMLDKAKGYLRRAEDLRGERFAGHSGTFIRVSETEVNLKGSGKSSQQMGLDRAHFLLDQALKQDEAGDTDDAIELYAEAVEVCLATQKECQGKEIKEQLAHLAREALGRAETLKAQKEGKDPQNTSPPTSSVSATPETKPRKRMESPPKYRGKLFLDEPDHTQASTSRSISPTLSTPAKGGYTREELNVLRATSRINGREYVPFMDVDLRERFAFPIPFSDKDGKLALAAKQQKRFERWIRPEEFIENPVVISKVDSVSVKQTVISDCSFIASLAIAARYEGIFKKRLLSSIIYPKGKDGHPVFNPCGKYMIKLHLNGIPRKVCCSPLSNRYEFRLF